MLFQRQHCRLMGARLGAPRATLEHRRCSSDKHCRLMGARLRALRATLEHRRCSSD